MPTDPERLAISHVAQRLSRQFTTLDTDLVARAGPALLAEPESDLSSLRSFWSAGPTAVASAAKQHSPLSPARHLWRQVVGNAPAPPQPRWDRDLNRALHVIAITRLRCHAESRDYEAKRTAQGKTHRDVRRSLIDSQGTANPAVLGRRCCSPDWPPTPVRGGAN